MISGEYSFYQNGKLIAVSKNLITNEGKKAILRYLAGKVTSWSGGLVIGADTATPAVTDTNLGFEFARGTVDLWAPDFTDNSIIVKGQIPTDVVGRVQEVGIHMKSENNYAPADSLLITDFDSNYTEITANPSFTRETTNIRIGRAGSGVSGAAGSVITVSLPYLFMDMGGYQTTDTFALAYYNADPNCASIKVRLITSAGNYYEAIVTPSASVGYKVSTFAKSTFTTVGAPEWTNITQIDFVVTAASGGASSTTLDGFRVNDTDYYDDFALVSRALVSPEIVKDDTQPLDIEYKVKFSFS